MEMGVYAEGQCLVALLWEKDGSYRGMGWSHSQGGFILFSADMLLVLCSSTGCENALGASYLNWYVGKTRDLSCQNQLLNTFISID
jgi:hypothetical protein